MATDSMPILQSRPEGPMDTERLADQLEKPLLDNRSYRVIRLPNKLEALLIHDPDTDKASAAMDVNVGSLADPEEMQGMAHAVEHLLFMGTEKVSTCLGQDRGHSFGRRGETDKCDHSFQAKTTTTHI
ncbi:A-factor-processing enzyme [Pseudocercospora fuligena]|uniref:A-factor-processing enzyme n=1 Tax=Pseudocercospora fuligena TaxID=685502 RepID=A0A8H6VJ70_9PEZI|nr:A-factor-processing enzyme [Pseudocercospora fuligena]